MRLTFGDFVYSVDDDSRLQLPVVSPELFLGRVAQVERPAIHDITEPFWVLITRVDGPDTFFGEVLASTVFLGYEKGDAVRIGRAEITFVLKKED